MEFQINIKENTSTIKQGDKEYEFNGILEKIIEFNSCFAVQLGDAKGKKVMNNVFVIYKTGKIKTIKNIVEEAGEAYKDDWFTTIVELKENVMQLWAYKGIDFSIDLDKGKIIRQEYAR